MKSKPTSDLLLILRGRLREFGLQRAVKAWLLRESGGGPEGRGSQTVDAEQALFEVFRRLPLDRPAPGFADRVLAQAGVRASEMPHWMRLLFNGFVAVCMLSVGLAAVFLPQTLFVLAPDFRWSGWIERGVEFATGATQRLVDSFSLWEALVGVGTTLADIIVSPAVVGVMTVSLCLSAVAMRALHELIVPERA